MNTSRKLAKALVAGCVALGAALQGFVAVLAVSMPLLASAFDTTGYVVLNNGGSTSIDPLLTPSCWTWPSGTPPAEMDTAAKYYSNLKVLWAFLSGTNGVFTVPGTEFVLERNSSSNMGVIRLSDKHKDAIAFNNLIVSDFTSIDTWVASPSPLSGKLTVLSSQAEPFSLSRDNEYTGGFTLTNMAIVGNADTGMDLCGPKLSSYPKFKSCNFKFAYCDMAGFKGRLRIRMKEGDPGDRAIRAIFRPTDLTMNGELVCEAGGSISLADVTSALTVKDLAMHDGALLEGLGAGRSIVVTNSLSVSGKVYLNLSGYESSAAADEIPILTCGADVDVAGIESSQFEVVGGTGTAYNGIPVALRSRIVWDSTGVGSTLKIVVSRVVTRQNVAAVHDHTDFEYATDKAGSSDFWSHGGCPDGDADASSTVYYNNVKPCYPPKNGIIYRFPGLALVLGNSSSLEMTNNDGYRGIEADIIAPGRFTYLQKIKGNKMTGQGYYDPETGNEFKSFVMKGSLHLLDNDTATPSFWTVSYGSHFLLASKLVGTGSIKCQGRISTQPSATYINTGDIELSADNSAFKGRIKLSESYLTYDGSTVPNDTDHMRLIVADGRSLGGARDTFAFDALALEHFSRLAVRTNVTLAADLNRGVAIGDEASFWVPAACALTVNQPVNLCGRLKKIGSGTLVLGGTAMTFGDDGSLSEPIANSNLLSVAAGALRVTNANAADGAAISLAAGTRLLVGTNDTVQTALRLVKSGSSLTADGGAIPVSFVVDAEAAAPFSTVICTAADPTLTFSCARPWPGWRANVKALTDAGVTTYTATVAKTGFIVIVE